MRKKGFYEKFLKRPFDFFVALVAIVLLSPIMIIVSFLILIKLGSPILFKQERPGKNEKIFKLFKFRTMTNKKDHNGNLLSDERRLTKFGKLLRSTSIDELPSLFNILIGDMSIVGPRPLLVNYLPLYNNEQRRRHSIRPGLTGLAQINGRNAISWDSKFQYDLHYVNKITFIEDVKIILKTIKKVFVREGISSKTSQTMEPFLGNEEMK